MSVVIKPSLRDPLVATDSAGAAHTAAIADAVRRFYDAHPYPPAVDDLDRYRRQWDDGRRRRAEFHRLWPHSAYRDDMTVLVAGCGTTQAAKYAIRWPRASVTGIDVSESSLRHAGALKQKHCLENLQLHALPIERVRELGCRFDHIVCTGVLHHLDDPDLALAALKDVLTPDGAIHVMVYAPYGRAGIYLLQDYCRRVGVRPTAEEIDDLVASLHALPQDHPFAALLRHAPDLQHRAGLADALLHPYDRAYSVPELLDFLARAGLRFGRFLRQAPYLPQCGAPAGAPHRPRLAALPPAEQYAAMELFRGTMVRHSVVAYRDSHVPRAVAIDWQGPRWLDYVPLRMPETLTVTERLPAGAAAVLINRRHTYTDLYLPVSPGELALVNAIDGARTSGQIAAEADDPRRVARLFERLWCYDHIVFDASGSSPDAARE
jgi:SAM-dependent methyltransferase